MVIAIMIAASIPMAAAWSTPENGTICWVVTDGETDKADDEYYYYDVIGDVQYENHEQEWWCMKGQVKVPISDEDWYIDTKVSYRISVLPFTHDVLFQLRTYDDGEYWYDEMIYWTIFEGDAEDGFTITLNLSWQNENDEQQYYEDSSVGYSPSSVDLDYLQILDIALTYEVDWGGGRTPGQKYYWIATDGELDQDDQWNNWTDSYEYYQDDFMEPGSPHNLTWWQDYTGTNTTIESQEWFINTKAEYWAEISGGNQILHLTIFSESNYYDEFFTWTVTNPESTGFFIVDCSSDDFTDWTSDPIDPDAGYDPNQKELGTCDNLTLSLYYYDGIGG